MGTALRRSPVLAATDGSRSASAAVAWAAGQAARTCTELVVITAYSWPVAGFDELSDAGHELRARLRAGADEVLTRAAATARAVEPDLAVRCEVTSGDPVSCLSSAAERASVVVLGSRGLGGVAGLLLGSTATAVVAGARCPVVVVHDAAPSIGTVVAGLDGGPADQRVLAFAFAHAEATGGGVTAVRAWHETLADAARTADLGALDTGPVARRARSATEDAVAPWRDRHPGVPIDLVIRRSRAAALLLDHAAAAALVVVGSRGRGTAAGLLLGSVSQAVVRHARCPVAVLRGTR
ncbi:hypothetical protein BJP25_11985 [Actinokineospora bangkokensis]|uniref:UspA domain-containing protein n=2 Tax=Actinokineospora bangkokensis TaxID=1193682 RepID=A0A1Q9LRV8_9PSEU|nr:hypothetical protein BJP25_11985 [Actinokineospora bangkokensis]